MIFITSSALSCLLLEFILSEKHMLILFKWLFVSFLSLVAEYSPNWFKMHDEPENSGLFTFVLYLFKLCVKLLAHLGTWWDHVHNNMLNPARCLFHVFISVGNWQDLAIFTQLLLHRFITFLSSNPLQWPLTILQIISEETMILLMLSHHDCKWELFLVCSRPL